MLENAKWVEYDKSSGYVTGATSHTNANRTEVDIVNRVWGWHRMCYDSFFRDGHETDRMRITDAMTMATAFIERGIAGTLDLRMDRYGAFDLKLDFKQPHEPTLASMVEVDRTDGLRIRAVNGYHQLR